MSDKNINKEQEFMLLLQKTLKEARENGGRISRDEISEISAACLWTGASSSRWRDI